MFTLASGLSPTLRQLTAAERLGFLRAYTADATPMARTYLEYAAVGLGWLQPAPEWKPLKAHGYDLVAFGEEVAQYLGDVSPLAVSEEGDRILSEAFAQLGGGAKEREAARGFSGATAAPPSVASSGSAETSTATPSP